MTDVTDRVAQHDVDLAVEFRDVRVQFGDTTDRPTVALENVSFKVAHGSFTSVIGPSGCGKTTLLRLLAGLERPTDGIVSFSGKPVEGMNPNIGFITQDSNLYPWMTVRANIEFPLQMRRVEKEECRIRSDNFIALIGLTGFENHYPHQLSGGMQKRVSVARTLIYEPSMVLMDEPFSALDAQTRMALQSDLQQMWSERSQTTLLVTHDLTEAIALSDKIVVMTSRPGKILRVFDVPLERPRDIFDVQAAPGFAELYDSIWDPLRGEVFASGTKSTWAEAWASSISSPARLNRASSVEVIASKNVESVASQKWRGWESMLQALSRSRRRRERSPKRYHLYRLAIVFAILGLWEGLADNGLISQLAFSHPSAIFPRMWLMVSNQHVMGDIRIYPQLKVTMEEWGLGYLIGSSAAIAMGFLLGRARALSLVVQPLILMFFGLPIIAIAPLFVVVFGIGLAAKIVTAMITAFFATFFQVFAGASNIPEVQIQLARLMGASRFQVAKRILLPATMPFVFVGLRLAVPAAMIGAIVGEFIVSSGGIGWFILQASTTLDSADLFAVLAILMVVVFVLGQVFLFLQGKALRWQPKPSRVAVRRPPST